MPRPKKEALPIHEELAGKQEIVLEAEPVQVPTVGEMVVGAEPVEEKKATKSAAKAEPFPYEQYFMTVEEEVDKSDDPRYPRYEIVKTRKLRREFAKNPHRIKCRIRAGSHFGVSVDHLKSSYNILSGKKIDGIIINDLIDRFGFSDGEQMNRNMVAERNKINVNAVEVAENKLKEMIIHKDVIKQYKNYLETFTSEAEHDIKRDSFNV